MLVLIVWSVKRRRRPHLKLEATGFDDLVPSIAGLTQGTCVQGNRVELVQDGAMWDRVLADIAAAKETINYETFLCKEGELTRRMGEALCAKAKEGVQVRVLFDGSGGKKFGKQGLQDMCDAGVSVRKYHPFRISNLGLINNRDHRKIFVIDGRIGYVGGHCLTDNWLGTRGQTALPRHLRARRGAGRRAVAVGIRGELDRGDGGSAGREELLPAAGEGRRYAAHVVWLSPSGSPSTLKLLHYMPDPQRERAAGGAEPVLSARSRRPQGPHRGGEARRQRTCHDPRRPRQRRAVHPARQPPPLRDAAQTRSENRRIQTTLLHQKIIIVDGKCASIGSTNFDDRSFEINDEVSLVVYDENVARELEETFAKDLKDATPVDLEQWKHRPVTHKLRDFFSFLFNEQL